MRKTENAALSREYMTAFLRRRSIIALGCCMLTLVLAFYGVVVGIDRTFIKVGPHAYLSFIFFKPSFSFFFSYSKFSFGLSLKPFPQTSIIVI